ncbi:MAG TPA: Smr/MutS family protein [Gemmatimonadales bacterium]|nr:Smr/MutS family protein [Gemmatimonadales bacterium]
MVRALGNPVRYSSGMHDWTTRSAAAEFDLHGQSVLEAAANAERFLLAQARVRRGSVVRIITGRGRGGGGAPIRTRVRTLLRRLREEGAVVRDYVLEASEGSFLVRLAD